MSLTIDFKKTDEALENCLIIPMYEDGELSQYAADFDAKHDGYIAASLKEADFKGKKSQQLMLMTPFADVKRLCILGLGKKAQLNAAKSYDIGGQLAQTFGKAKITKISMMAEGLDQETAYDIAFGVMLGNYQFDKYLDEKKKTKTIETFTVHNNDLVGKEDAFQEFVAVAESVHFARDLVNEPGNAVNPRTFAQKIEELTSLGLKVKVLSVDAMKDLGMNALLGVGQGSEIEPRLVEISYMGAENGSEAPIAFVGKGVTFDSGGLSLKPPKAMEEMKLDMGGAAAVVGVMRALAQRKAAVNAVGVVGLVENMPSGNAQRPGDIVKTMSGQTVEVLNTDAEGRLVLADAITYTQNNFAPKAMIDLATLTGAILISLGYEYAGIFYNNDELKDQIFQAGEETGEKAWPFPMTDGFDKSMNSKIADMKNISSLTPWGGSITAAQFLKRFVKKDIPWVHLDIAGTAYNPSDLPRSHKGATGYGVILLNQLVKNHYESK